MKPYSNQLYGPTALPYTVGVTWKNNFIDQKTLMHRLRPGYHTTIHIIPKIIESTPAFDNLDLDIRKCKLPHETTGFLFFQKYTRRACEIECAAKKASSFCKCLPWYYPNNFTILPMCDMFGGYCFNEIMSNIVFYKKCKTECLEDCQETSFSMWHNTFPLDAETLCKDNTYFDKFFSQNFQRLFAFKNYEMLLKKQSTLDLETSLQNGSLCTTYLNEYVSLVSVESPTKSVTKSQRDQRKFFIDKLGTIGGTLGVCAGFSVLSMIEALVFFYIVIIGIMMDMRDLWRKMISHPKKVAPVTKKKSDSLKNIVEFYHDDIEKGKQEIKKLYVSNYVK